MRATLVPSLMVVLSVLSLAAGCAHAPTPVVQEEVRTAAPVKETKPQLQMTAQPQAVDDAALLEKALHDAVVYFDFDADGLKPDGMAQLQRIADILRRSPALHVRVEGNCDERGTEEYNLLLGQRRAAAAVKYLEDLGVAPKQLDVISYGDERPAVAGHDETAWAKNRRDDVTRVR